MEFCKHCGERITRVRLAEDHWIWCHVDTVGYQNMTGDLGQSCNLIAEPKPFGEEHKIPTIEKP